MYSIMMIAFWAICSVLLARKGRPKRKFRRYLRGNVDEKLSLPTLAAQAAAVGAFGEAVTEKTFVTSLIATWALQEFTVQAGDGPVMVGVMHSDYTQAELEEFIENTGSWNEASLVQTKEIGRRLIKVVGIFRTPTAVGQAAVLNDGRPIRTRLNWMLTSGQTLDLWAYNLGSSAFGTTVPDLFVQGHVNLWPR